MRIDSTVITTLTDTYCCNTLNADVIVCTDVWAYREAHVSQLFDEAIHDPGLVWLAGNPRLWEQNNTLSAQKGALCK